MSDLSITPDEIEMLRPFAQRYVWWKTPEEALDFPHRIIAAVMEKGDWEDVIGLETLVGRSAFKEALAKASVGEFRPRSWHFWHKRLFGAETPVPLQKLHRF